MLPLIFKFYAFSSSNSIPMYREAAEFDTKLVDLAGDYIQPVLESSKISVTEPTIKELNVK